MIVLVKFDRCFRSVVQYNTQLCSRKVEGKNTVVETNARSTMHPFCIQSPPTGGVVQTEVASDSSGRRLDSPRKCPR